MPNCKYCGEVENKQYSPCLECKLCHAYVHLECLLVKESPGNFPGDVFFIFTCAECSENGEELFERGKMTWFHCLIIVLHDLTSKCSAISNQGFFHWRTHIGSFINRNWHLLFHPQFKRRKNWAGTFSGSLSLYSPTFFQSGATVLNEQGWWKLTHGFSPALIKHLTNACVEKLRINHYNSHSEIPFDAGNSPTPEVIKSDFSNVYELSYNNNTLIGNLLGMCFESEKFQMDFCLLERGSEIILMKQKERLNKNPSNFLNEKEMEYAIMKQLVTDLGFSGLLSKGHSKFEVINQPKVKHDVVEEAPSKKLKLQSLSPHPPFYDTAASGNYTFKNESKSSVIDEYLSNYFLDGEESLSDFDSFLPDFEELSESSGGNQLQNGLINNHGAGEYHSNYPSSGENCDSDFISQSPRSQNITRFNTCSEGSNDSKVDTNKLNQSSSNQYDVKPKPSFEYLAPPVVSGLFTKNKDDGEDLPWNDGNQLKNNSRNESLISATEYEEVQMLNNLNSVCRKAQYENIDKNLIRLRAKLSLRKLKKSKHLPVWNLDRLVCKLANFPVQDSLSQFTQQDIRILDRFQHVADSLSGSTFPSQVGFAMRLAGCSEVSPFLSPYSGRLLKPYIRRDTETIPPWLRLMNELRHKVNSSKSSSIIYEAAPLDYCYVRPQHIASINSLCAQYFWPGIDLTESLQYPDFSCVVLYKKLVVAFAFLVPDVGPNETYISFIFTRPEWRKSGIANFMLYHLIQTCIDKDITLHVSATNPGVFIYQKFGFKIEELIQEFYEKYFPAESTECKHALFLRLCR